MGDYFVPYVPPVTRAERETAYARAAAAAEAWTGRPASDEFRAWQRRVCDLALQHRAIDLRWLRPGMTSTRLASRGGGGLAVIGERVVVSEPIVDVRTLCTALHELGHVRSDLSYTDPVTSRIRSLARCGAADQLVREALAWAWAMRHAPFWDDACRADMSRCLQTYVQAAQLPRVLSVQAVEYLLSDGVYRAEQHRRMELFYEETKRARDTARADDYLASKRRREKMEAYGAD